MLLIHQSFDHGFSKRYFVSEIENDAVKIEWFIKKQKSRTFLENLINPDFQFVGKLAHPDSYREVRVLWRD